MIDNDVITRYFDAAGLDVDRIGFIMDCLGFAKAPASKGHHLACPGGLAAHSINVANRLVCLSAALDVKWSRKESPYLVGMLHDLVKTKCYRVARDTELDGVGCSVARDTGRDGGGCRVARDTGRDGGGCRVARDTGRDGVSYEYVNPGWPGHGEASVMIATVDAGIKLNADEAAAIRWHMGAFGLSEKEFKYFNNALEKYPGHIIATHCADWYAARVDEEGDFKK